MIERLTVWSWSDSSMDNDEEWKRGEIFVVVISSSASTFFDSNSKKFWINDGRLRRRFRRESEQRSFSDDAADDNPCLHIEQRSVDPSSLAVGFEWNFETKTPKIDGRFFVFGRKSNWEWFSHATHRRSLVELFVERNAKELNKRAKVSLDKTIDGGFDCFLKNKGDGRTASSPFVSFSSSGSFFARSNGLVEPKAKEKLRCWCVVLDSIFSDIELRFNSLSKTWSNALRMAMGSWSNVDLSSFKEICGMDKNEGWVRARNFRMDVAPIDDGSEKSNSAADWWLFWGSISDCWCCLCCWRYRRALFELVIFKWLGRAVWPGREKKRRGEERESLSFMFEQGEETSMCSLSVNRRVVTVTLSLSLFQSRVWVWMCVDSVFSLLRSTKWH